MYDENAAQLLHDLEALKAEIRKALYITRLGEVMGHGVMDAEVPLLAAILREPAQPDGPPGR